MGSKNKNARQKTFPKTYKEMIKDCLKANEERTGLSAHQLKTYIKDTYKNEAKVKVFNQALKELVSSIEINQKKGHYKMTKDQKVNKKELAAERRKKAAAKTKARKEALKAKRAAKRKATQNKKKTIKKTKKKTTKKTVKKSVKKTNKKPQ